MLILEPFDLLEALRERQTPCHFARFGGACLKVASVEVTFKDGSGAYFCLNCVKGFGSTSEVTLVPLPL